MIKRTTFLIAACVALVTTASAQESKQWFKSPRVAFSNQSRVDDLVDLDNDGDLDLDLVGRHTILNNAHTPATHGLKRQYGQGTPGSAGIEPRLSATGPFIAGQPASISVTGGVGGSSMILVFGDQPLDHPNTPLPGLSLYTNAANTSAWTLGGTYGVPGTGTIQLNDVVPSFVAGQTYYHEVFLFDPGVPGYITHTGGLQISYQ
ncbi:MAG: hypothetical protein KDB53_15685 [Planctomycetes bacterium]|nr:hypothetical protein [Planctomycetota bacterium]